MVERQKGAIFLLGIEFSIKHPLFALLVRHSEWILNHLFYFFFCLTFFSSFFVFLFFFLVPVES